MQFSSSLKLNHIFRRLYRKGSSAANGYLVLYCRKNGSQANRVGLTVGAMGRPLPTSRLYSASSVYLSYSGWPVTKICRPFSVLIRKGPASSLSARMRRALQFSTSSRLMPKTVKW